MLILKLLLLYIQIKHTNIRYYHLCFSITITVKILPSMLACVIHTAILMTRTIRLVKADAELI